MKILLLFPMADGQTGPAIKRAFENLGHSVMAIDAKVGTCPSYSELSRFKPELVFCSRTEKLASWMKGIKKYTNIPVCMWNVDTRYDIYHWKHLFQLIELCDYHFIVDTKTVSDWQKINKNTFWLPQGLQNEVYKKPLLITNKDREKYSCDVSWAGSCTGSHAFRERFLMAVRNMGINFKVWGCKGKPKIYNEEYNKMVSLSKINLAMSGWPLNGQYTSVRNYKIMGAGGFVLEYGREGLYRLFDSHIRWYDNPGQLVEMIRFWLNPHSGRKDDAKEGYEWVNKYATYTVRMKQALEIMGLTK